MSRLILLVCALLISVVVATHVSVDVSVGEPHHMKSHHMKPHHPHHEEQFQEHNEVMPLVTLPHESESEAEIDMAADSNSRKDYSSDAEFLQVGSAAGDAPVANTAPVIAHGTANQHWGIDTSHYDHITDFKAIVAYLTKQGSGGTPFCIQKISEGAGGLDKTASRNIPAFQKEGCLTGAYHFMRVSAGVDAQVNVILNNRHGAKYVVLDAEIDEKNAGPTALAIIKKLEAHGIKPILYSMEWLAAKWGAKKWGVPLWIARYMKTPPKYGDLWQYTEKGRVPGCTTNVDLSKMLITNPTRFEEIFY